MSLYVEVKGDDIKAVVNAITKFNRLVKKSEIMDELWNRREYVKPSKKKKLKRERALVKKIRQQRLDEKKNRKLNQF